MNIDKLNKLLTDCENPKLEFKRQWYCGDREKLDDQGWGEFLKDIIALANGNIGYVGKTGYLIIGASDEDPQPSQVRDTFHIDNKGMLSNLQHLRDQTLKKLSELCSPRLSEIKFNFISLEAQKNLLMIEIPSPIDLLKLDRDLNTRGMRYRKGTIFIRSGQDIIVADPTEISRLKDEYSSRYQTNINKTQKVLHNLQQPDYVNFVGRKDELERLRKLLHPQDRIWTIVIDGIGGIGKSALALEIAHRYLNEYDFLPQEERFKAIIWISAKSSFLTVEGVKPRYQITNTIHDIYRDISIVIGEDSIYRKNFYEQILLIRRALSQQRTLLIIDNYETIDDERVNTFIRELPNPTKCIVTTRHRIDIADPIRLSAMLRDEALSLIKQECKKKNVQLQEEEAELLYKRTAGVPLALVWSIAQISHYGFSINKVLRHLGDAKGDIARFCFEKAVQYIQDKPAYKLLICISLLLYDRDRKYLGYISDLSELDRDEGLVTLEKLSLINKKNNQFNILPLVREYVLAHVQNFNFEELENIIIRITEDYAPSGGNAIAFIDKFFEPKVLENLKNKVTEMIADKMWEWDSYYDEMGVYYCISALEKLATDEAIIKLKEIAINSFVYYSYSEVINILTRLKKIKDLIELTLIEKKINNLVVDALKTFEVAQVKGEIEKLLQLSSTEEEKKLLQELNNKFSLS